MGEYVNFTPSEHNLVYAVLKSQQGKIPPKLLEYWCFRKINSENFEEDFNSID